MPWHYPEDLQFFAQTISTYPIAMGRKTWETFPKNYCKERLVIVFSRSQDKLSQEILQVSSMEEFTRLDLASPIFLIGGSEIYSLFLYHNAVQSFFVSHIKKMYNGDAFFPLSLLQNWKKQILLDSPDKIICYYENHFS
ncbi:Dihydrofolate reductase [Candidatus Chlamydia sanziniae]|uniref:dihydrofolate reductase n=1 Tax=Candidatus Chlamydia sanziniae TaxID=1806891 RepID=A0A1A9HWU5_9CHLA|nr:Dihydrofolate reductase [Candidatus Chlamydia sanziniae]